MEIQSLRAFFSEQDLNDLAERHLTKELPVKNFAVSVIEDGLAMKGVYRMILKVNFELHWKIGVYEGKAVARLAGCKAFGVSASMIKGMVLKAVKNAVLKEQAVIVENDTVFVDIDHLLTKNGLATKSNLTAIVCRDGGVWIEAEKT